MTERTRGKRESAVAGTHIKHVERCPPEIEIEFVRFVFQLKKIESRGVEFNIRKSSLKDSSPGYPDSLCSI